MHTIHTDQATIQRLKDTYWKITFLDGSIVTLVEIMHIYQLISTYDFHCPLLLDFQKIGGLEYEALEFTTSLDPLTERTQLIVYTPESISEKYVSLIESMDLGHHGYHIFPTIDQAKYWIAENIHSNTTTI